MDTVQRDNPEPEAPARPEPILTYDGVIGEVVRLGAANLIVTVLTLGLYRFWGKSRMRRYVWSHVSLQQDRWEYAGTGRELFLGFLVALLVMIPLFGVFSAVTLFHVADDSATMLIGGAQYVVILFLVQIARFRARRYRLTRTRWRGIRGGQTGSAIKYATLSVALILLTVLTLGLAYPVMSVRLQAYRSRHTWFGDAPLTFTARARDMFRPWILHWLLLLPTLGISYIWFAAGQFRYFASHTRYRSLRFRSGLQSRTLLRIVALYLLAVFGATSVAITAIIVLADDADTMVQLGVAAAILVPLLSGLVARPALFLHPLLVAICGTLSILGEQDFSAVRQSPMAAPGPGEGLASALDAGEI